MQYKHRSEAKEWAWANMKGVANVTLPTFTSDLKRLNEKAIRHDIRKNIEFGFEGTLLVSEAGTTMAEYKQFIDIAVDEAKGRIQIIGHGSFDTPADVVEAMKYGEANGLDSYLFAFPPSFYPKTGNDVLQYVQQVNEQLHLGCIMFPAAYWNFGRLHPSGWPPELCDAVADIPNVIAFKYESIGNAAPGMLEVVKKIGKKVIVTDPFDTLTPLWVELVGTQWLGTSQYEYYAGEMPRMWNMLKSGQWDEAMQLYWRLHPARQAKSADKATWVNGANFLHRYVWKYMQWLNGYNGGPIRMPVMRMTDGQKALLRGGLEKSGIKTTESTDAEFYVGRNPA